MNKVYIGKIVNTHGIKGELRILSDFQFKDKVFLVGNTLLIDDKEYKIRSYRHHKIFEMVTLNDYDNINDVEYLINKKVYFDMDSVKLKNNEVLDEDLVNFKAIYNNKEYPITDVFYASRNNKIIRVLIDNKEVLIPYNSPMVVKIDKENKVLYIDLIDGVI